MADTVRQPISIGAYTFDPLTERPDIPPEMSAIDRPTETAYTLVQLAESPTRAERERLQSAYGLALDAYVPDLAFVERITPRNRDALVQDPAVRALVKYHPAFKISPKIGTFRFHTEAGLAREGLYLRAVLFPTGDPEAVAAKIEALGASNVRVIDDRAIHGQARVEFVAQDQSISEEIARIEDVRWIEEIPEVRIDNGNTAGTMQSGVPGTTPIWNQGIQGEGQIVGIIDNQGLDLAHCWFIDNGNNTPNPAHRKVIGHRNDSDDPPGFHSTFVGGIVAGDDVNNIGADPNRGNAFNARLTYGNNADLSLFGGNFSLLNYLTQAMNDGAFIHTNSWHEDTLGYTQESADVDTLVWNNEAIFVCGSSGNTGNNETIGPPGTAKNALCVSAAQRDPNELNFGDGNNGPTDDGRRKPEIFAPGCNITSADVGSGCGTIMFGCATSWATPATAAAAALVRQYYLDGWYPTGTQQAHHGFTPSGALIKATLLNSTLDMNIAGYPGNQEGWGLLRLDNVLTFQGGPRNTRVWDTRNADGLVTGEQRFHHIDVASNAQPLKVTLVWSEPPAAAGANSSPINDLDLTVVSPDGSQVFTGNVFNNGFSATGGVPDTVNNVEQVWINNPPPGDWTIIVGATNVNVGNPGQGYAITATADLVEPPLTVGQQDTLVVRVLFADIAFEPSQANLINLMTDVAGYIDEVSYGQATVNPLFRGPIQLDHPRDYYFHPERNPLIELAEEVAAKLVAAEAGIFTRGTANPADDIDRMIIVINDPNFTGDWATTGPWPYDLPGGFTQPISVSIQSYQNPAARFTHGLLHHFGLVDLYAHPGVVFPKAYVDEWDNMSNLFTNVHPLVWEKERAGWLTAHGSEITYIPRPATGGSYTGLNPIPLFFQESTAQNRKAIAIGLTQGAATLAQEQAFYYIEARSNTAGGFDDGLPGTGVLIYYVNELIEQGQGPVILQDRAPGTASLGDAFFQVGDSRAIPGTGITVTVQAGTGGADFNIQLAYVPPVTDYNLSIVKGDTIDGEFIPWFSPDIWIDSPRNGFDLGAGPPPFDQKDNPVIGEINRIYARVHNAGPGTAFDFDVRFRVSEPYHTIGDVADFDTFVGIKHVAQLNAGADTNVFVEWTPTDDGDPHSCVLVDLINLVGTDTNPNDHEAQENLEEVTSVTQSPFHAVDYRFDLTNPYPESSLFYFKAEGVPPGWTTTIVPHKVRLDPGQRMEGTATVQPPEDAEVCDSRLIRITSWSPQGDTIVPVGGGGVIVNLRKPTLLTLDVDTGPCDGRNLEELMERYKKEGKEVDPKKLERKCGVVTAQGCTNPPQPNQEIIVKFIDPQGNPVYMTVTTDANGCFEAMLVTATQGGWEVVAEYPGDKCQGEVVVSDTTCHCR